MDRAVLIYDEACPICNASAEWLREHQKKEAFDFLACQSQERRERYPQVIETACMEAMQLVLPDGAVLSGERALPEVIRRLRGLGPFALIFDFPGAYSVAGPLYRWFARRRYRIASVFMPGIIRKHRKKSMAQVVRESRSKGKEDEP